MNSTFFHRLGLVPKQRERTLWLVGASLPAFESMAPLLEELARTQPRLHIILSADEAQLRATLKQKFPHCLVWPLPFGNGFSIGEYLSRGNIRTVCVLEDADFVSPALLAGLNRRAVALVALSARAETVGPVSAISKAAELVVEIGSPRSGMEELATQYLSVKAGAQLLGEMLGRDLKSRRDAGESADWFWRAVVKNCDKGMLCWRLHRFRNVSELGDALNDPQTILCLGNGPSSEDPAVKDAEHDVLFRVNHSWAKRGFLVKPDVVFAGGRPSMRVVGSAIFGLQNSNAERRLAAVRALNPLRGQTRFFKVGDMSPLVNDFPWGALRPTNGATMLAAAVALKPKRLIVAGIDMFQHPEGSYPGDTATPNAFSPAHTREAEQTFIFTLFEGFEGELVIIGDVLQKAWHEHQSSRAAKQRR